MKLLLPTLLLLSACAPRRLPSTPSFLVIPAVAYSCTGPTETHWDQCRYTLQDGHGVYIRRVEFPRARGGR